MIQKGDQEWYVRFFAQHAAILYFFGLSILWTVSPSLSYNFSELIEMHAVDTYSQFADENKELLLTLSAPPIAKAYYEALDLYVFDEFQTNSIVGLRRPKINNLYDVVCSIRDDEREHSATMKQCQDPNVLVRSPNTEAAIISSAAAAALVTLITSGQFGEVSLDDINTIISSATTTAQSDIDVEELSEVSIPLIENLMKILGKIL
jgi:ubiquinol oxidase